MVQIKLLEIEEAHEIHSRGPVLLPALSSVKVNEQQFFNLPKAEWVYRKLIILVKFVIISLVNRIFCLQNLGL